MNEMEIRKIEKVLKLWKKLKMKNLKNFENYKTLTVNKQLDFNHREMFKNVDSRHIPGVPVEFI